MKKCDIPEPTTPQKSPALPGKLLGMSHICNFFSLLFITLSSSIIYNSIYEVKRFRSIEGVTVLRYKEVIMQLPPEISLRNIEMTPLVDKLIARGIAGLEQLCDYIIRIRIALEQEQGRHRTGNAYRMRIDIRIPHRADIVVRRSSKARKKMPVVTETPLTPDKTEVEGPQPAGGGRPPVRKTREEPLLVLIGRTFESARRELRKIVDKQGGQVKAHSQPQIQAVVEKIFPEQQYGFLRTSDGQQVYFHKNSVLHNHWGHLTVGTAVRYVPEVGEKGLQASTVEPVDKPGAAEIHDRLHDLPRVSP